MQEHEQQISPEKVAQDDRTLEQVENYIQQNASVMDELRDKRFASFNDAQQAEQMIHEKLDRLNAINGADGIIFEVSGSGVSRQPFLLKSDTSGPNATAFSISLDGDDLEPFDIVTSRNAVIKSFGTSVEQDELGFKVSAKYFLQEVQPDVMILESEDAMIPAAEIIVIRNYIADCSSDSVFDIPELREQRAKQQLAEELAIKGLAQSALNRKLEKLRSTLAQEQEEFTDMPSVSLLHDIGRLAGEHSRRGPEYSELVRRALLDVISPERRIVVSGYPINFENGTVSVDAQGPVVDVLLPESRDDELRPSIALETSFDGENKSVLNFPLERISALRF